MERKVPPTLQIVPSIFRPATLGAAAQGDFSAMITLPVWHDALFVFNDNLEDHATAQRGGGNAAIRPFNRYGTFRARPRSAGIPTGSLARRGFTRLDAEAKPAIDSALHEIAVLVRQHGYRRLVYSAGPDGRTFGTGIFTVAPAVLAYITDRIWALASP